MVDLFRMLGNDVRVRILKELAAKGTCTFSELNNVCRVSAGTLAYHLGVLKELVSKKGDRYCLTETGHFAHELVAQAKDFKRKQIAL